MISYAVSQVKMINDNLQPKLKNSMVFPLLVDTGAYIIKLDTSGVRKEVSSKLNKVVNSKKKTLKEISQKEIQKEIDLKIKEAKKVMGDHN